MDYTDQIKNVIAEWGADLVGIADVKSLRGLNSIPRNLFDPFTRAVSIAVRLPVSTFETIFEQPTPNYASVYQTANRLLDEIAFKASKKIEDDGYLSLPMPASQVLDKENWYAAISHKAVARVAGLGWQGKNLLLITPRFGPRVRLVTVLTSAPLKTDSPITNRCGKCMLCRDACPVGAIKGVSTKDHYENRNEALFFHKCLEKLMNDFAKLPDIGAPICGICIKACPYGKDLEKKKKDNSK